MSFIDTLIIYFIFRTGTFMLYNFHSYVNQNRTLFFCLHNTFSFILTLYLKVYFGKFQAWKKINNKEILGFESVRMENLKFLKFCFSFVRLGFFFSLQNPLFFEAMQTYGFFSGHLPISLVLFSKNKDIKQRMIRSENH